MHMSRSSCVVLGVSTRDMSAFGTYASIYIGLGSVAQGEVSWRSTRLAGFSSRVWWWCWFCVALGAIGIPVVVLATNITDPSQTHTHIYIYTYVNIYTAKAFIGFKSFKHPICVREKLYYILYMYRYVVCVFYGEHDVCRVCWLSFSGAKSILVLFLFLSIVKYRVCKCIYIYILIESVVVPSCTAHNFPIHLVRMICVLPCLAYVYALWLAN